jgi:hypothetical protein
MRSLTNEHISRCERALATATVAIAADLRKLDPTDLVAWLRGHRYGNIAALINASSELLFAPGTLRFALSGGADLSWSGELNLHLDMEFHHQGVHCYFRWHIERAHVGVAITYMMIDGVPCESCRQAARFESTLSNAAFGAVTGTAAAVYAVQRKFGATKRN